MSLDWSWPGARWWRCDLHVHSPASHDFRDCEATAADWVQAAVDRGVEVVAVTDHDAAGFTTDARAAAGDRIVVLAGVEITSSEGIHLVVLLGEAAAEDEIRGLLGACGVPPTEWGKPSARAAKPLLDCIRIASGSPYHGLCIPAHADAAVTETNPSSASLLRGAIDVRAQRAVLGEDGVVAVETCGSDAAEHAFLTGLQPAVGRRRPGLPLVQFSDAHGLDEIGRRTTLIKMTRPDLDGLRLAFADGQHSVRAGDADANEIPAQAIESISIEEAKLAGRSGPLLVGFNPWLSAIIGGRGSGKSTVVNLLRAALDRVDAPSATRGELDAFLQVPTGRDAQGALTAATKVVVTYRKDSVRFRAVWNGPGSPPQLQEEDETGAWRVADGSVRTRLPVQIFGQGEIHETARQTQALLEMINEAPEQGYSEWRRLFDTAVAGFHALRAQARQEQAALPNESEARGELEDVERGLAAFEAAEHQEILQRYQRARRQQAEISRLADEIEAVGRRALAALPDQVPASLDHQVFDPSVTEEAPVAAAAERVRSEVRSVLDNARQRLSAVERAGETFRIEVEQTAWSQAARERERAYAGLVEQLQQAGVEGPERYAGLVERRQQLTAQLAELASRQRAVAELEAQAASALDGVQQMRRDISNRRRAFLDDLLRDNDFVHIQLKELGVVDAVDDEIRQLLGVDSGFSDDIARLIRLIVDGGSDPYECLDTFKSRVREVARADSPPDGLADARFAIRLSRLSSDGLDRVDSWFPEDALEVSFSSGDGTFRPLLQGSAGQRNAAILAFLFSHGEEPIIIDQPENDLDNRLIANLVVEQLRQVKPRRQVVLVSHNPNIVVNGDADLIAALHIPSGEIRIEEHGGLQEEKIRAVVCDVMEGGREALESRYSRIAMRSTAR